MASDDSLTRSAPSSPSEVIRSLRENPTGLPKRLEARSEASSPDDLAEIEVLDPLPRSADDYVACGRASNRTLVTLLIMLKDGSFDGFAYASLERVGLRPAAEIGEGNELTLRFSGSTVTEVRLKGRNLLRLFANIARHRTPWIRELPVERDFQPAGEAVVTSISVSDL